MKESWGCLKRARNASRAVGGQKEQVKKSALTAARLGCSVVSIIYFIMYVNGICRCHIDIQRIFLALEQLLLLWQCGAFWESDVFTRFWSAF